MSNYYYNNNRNSYNRNRQNNNDGDWLSWVIIAILFFSGAWFIALPWLFIKLFASDKKQTRQAPPLNRTTTVYRDRGNVYSGTQTYTQRPVQQPVQQTTAQKESTFGKLTRTPKDSKSTRIGLIAIGAFLAFFGLTGCITKAGELIAYGFFLSDFYTAMTGLGIAVGGAAMIGSGVSMSRAQKRYARYIAVIGTNEAVHIKTIAKKLGIDEKRVRKDLQKMIEKDYFGESAYINDELGYLFLNSKADDEIREAKAAAEVKTQEARARQNADKKSQELSMYDSIIHQIRDVNDRIAHVEMSRKIYHIEDTTRKIFDKVEKEPAKKNKIDRFLTYYLPTTLKLLETYAKLEATGSTGENVEESKASIEGAMDSIVQGFDNLLDDLYDADVVDIKSDIDVMQQMMNQDGANRDFKIDKSKKKESEDTRTQFQKDFGIWPEGTKPVETGAAGTATQASSSSSAAVQEQK